MLNDISYTLIKARRKNISLSVNKQGLVEVKAPIFASKKTLDDFVWSKKDWIDKARRKISALVKTPRADSVHEINRQKIIVKRLIDDRIKHYNSEGRFEYKKITIKDLNSRWGSCSLKGNLNFNYRLVYLPPALLDYVVVHELCHLIEHNHGPQFWQEVKNILNDFKTREKEIKKYSL